MTKLKSGVMAIFGVVAAMVLIFHMHKPITHAAQNAVPGQYKQAVQAGLGSEVYFASTQSGVSKSVQSLATYIEYRSGITLSPQVMTQLAKMESQALTDPSKCVSVDQFTTLLTTVGFDRISKLSDADVDSIVHQTNFDAPDMPDMFKSDGLVRVRASKLIQIGQDDFTTQLRALRTTSGQQVAFSATNSYLREIVWDRLQSLSDAVPGAYGRNWQQAAHAPGAALTPVRAFLLAYSVATDDNLMYNQQGLQQQMQRWHDGAAKYAGHYPEPGSYHAYGSNGYLFSFPADLLFDDETQANLLTSFAGGTNR